MYLPKDIFMYEKKPKIFDDTVLFCIETMLFVWHVQYNIYVVDATIDVKSWKNLKKHFGVQIF